MPTMSRMDTMSFGFAFLCAIGLPVHAGDWVEFADETATRMPTPLNDPALSSGDLDEKDYAWGDVDQDGDIDLVVVRKEPFTTVGRRVGSGTIRTIAMDRESGGARAVPYVTFLGRVTCLR